MPGHNGQKLVSETMVRSNRQCRIVFTIEVQAGENAWSRKPKWKSQAMDLIRDTVIQRTLEYVLRSAAVHVLVPRDFKVIETKVEVGK